MPRTGIDLHIFWAKTTHDARLHPRAFHPLLCHMIDSAVVTRRMWRESLPAAARRRIARVSGLDEETTETFVAWLSGLHDIGKASPPFALRELRDKSDHLHRLYENTPFSRGRNSVQIIPAGDAPHGIVTAYTLPSLLKEMGFPHGLADQVAVIIGGHHGVVPRSEDTMRVRRALREEKEEWQQARRALVGELASRLRLPHEAISSLNGTLDNASAMWLAGLVSVADWIASNQVYFPCKIEDAADCQGFDFANYLQESEGQAQEALAKLGWSSFAARHEPCPFGELFPTLKGRMRPLQESVIRLAERMKSPGIVIIEAPTGEGKTEAAMYLADSWGAHLSAARGCYFALPTQATSNQMFGRVRDFLSRRYEDALVNLQLLHGHASLSAEFLLLRSKADEVLDSLKVEQIYDDEERAQNRRHDEDRAGVVAAEWFTYRKRGLLAPFGVGTVDQALLSVLQTKHVFVRLFALAHKTVIVDEVHAYDAYISALLERLLEWLAALGSPVVLLSATLPRERRRALVKAYVRGLSAGDEVGGAPAAETDAIDVCYPHITWATASEAGAETIRTSAQNSRTLYLNWLEGQSDAATADANELGWRLREALSDGGCAAVICNTVGLAQEVFLRLQEFFRDVPPNERPALDLLHARFLYRDRAARERRALLSFGKSGAQIEDEYGGKEDVRRPARAVLVSTQIIEQSLDIDFDLMISELAPVDLLLQRAGRLHRHDRPGQRPDKLQRPSFWLIKSELDADGLPDFGASAFVYAPHVLLRTWLELRHRQTICIPSEVEDLIEAVYDDRACPEMGEGVRKLWEDTIEKLVSKRQAKESKAKPILIPPTTYDWEEAREFFNQRLEEDAPDIHPTLQALTRDDELPNVSVVCLGPDEIHTVDLKDKPMLEAVRFLLERSVNINRPGVVREILATEAPRAWRESPHLRHHRLVELDEAGRKPLDKVVLRLDPNLGIVFDEKP